MFKFIKSIFKGTLILVFSWFVFLFSFALIVAFFAAGAQPQTKPIKQESILVISLSRNIPDKPPSMEFSEALRSIVQDEDTDDTYLYEMIKAIERAAEDRRIEAIYMEGNLRSVNYGSGYPALREIRTALKGFQETGKPVYAYVTNPSQRDLYLVSVADEVFMHPMGLIDVSGLGGRIMFYKGMMEKFGVGVQVTRQGKYKSAMESFTNDKLSPENREQTQVLMDGMWDGILTAIAENRDLDKSDLVRLSQEAPFIYPEDAREYGLIDTVYYRDEVLDFLIDQGKEEEDSHTFRQVGLVDYIAEGQKKIVRSEDPSNEIALVYAEGAISAGSGSSANIGGKALAKQLRKIRNDEDVQAVVLRVNSPGGSALGSELVLRELSLIHEEKPVIVSFGAVAASGGYWIASASDRIFADEMTITGSIGVILALANYEGAAEWLGLSFDEIATGPYAAMFDPSEEKTDEEMALIQDFTDDIYDKFLDRVSGNRGLDRERVHDMAQGRVWLGSDAKDLGLVDELGGLLAAIDFAIESAGVGADFEIVEYPQKRTIEEALASAFDTRITAFDAIQSDIPEVDKAINEVKASLEKLREFDDPRGLYLRLPYELQF